MSTKDNNVHRNLSANIRSKIEKPKNTEIELIDKKKNLVNTPNTNENINEKLPPRINNNERPVTANFYRKNCFQNNFLINKKNNKGTPNSQNIKTLENQKGYITGPGFQTNLIEKKKKNSFSIKQNTVSLQSKGYSKYNNTLSEQYRIGPIIGQGSYAIVRVAEDVETKEKVAIKTYEKVKLFDPQKRKNVQREIAILRKIGHPNIISLVEIVDDYRSINLVMEYIGSSSLKSYLKAKPNRKIKEEEAKHLFRQIISSLSYCHSKNLVHRDIKLENIIIDKNKNVKLIDFGFSIFVQEKKKLNIFCGTPTYMAPEIVAKKEYFGAPVDVWASGILLYVLLCGRFPFKSNEENALYRKIQKGQFEMPETGDVNLKSLFGKILETNPYKRITAEQILNEPWLKTAR